VASNQGLLISIYPKANRYESPLLTLPQVRLI